MARLAAGLDADGMPAAWTIRLAGPSFVASLVPELRPQYRRPHFRQRSCRRNALRRAELSGRLCRSASTPVPLGVWRAINYTQNAFYKECFVDEMAHAAGIDPYLYRRQAFRHNPKNLAVLDAAAKQAGWDTRGRRPEYFAASRSRGLRQSIARKWSRSR